MAYQFKKIAQTDFKGHPLETPIEAFNHHLPRIALFWRNQLIGEPLPPETPAFDLINIHSPLNIKRGELGRWLVLFRETLIEVLKEESDKELKEQWLEKLITFERAFLKSKNLFSV